MPNIFLESRHQLSTPIKYTIKFNGSGALPTGSFLYDASKAGIYHHDGNWWEPAFSEFVVTWYGITIDMTDAANRPSFDRPTPDGLPKCLGGPVPAGGPGPGASFAFLSGACAPPPAHFSVPEWKADYVLGELAEFRFFFYSEEPLTSFAILTYVAANQIPNPPPETATAQGAWTIAPA